MYIAYIKCNTVAIFIFRFTQGLLSNKLFSLVRELTWIQHLTPKIDVKSFDKYAWIVILFMSIDLLHYGMHNVFIKYLVTVKK